MAIATFSHPSLGEVKYSSAKDGVQQYLGVQYATLKDRFAPAVLKEYTGDKTIDATKVGPETTHIPNGPQMEQGLIQHTLPDDTSGLIGSDTEGLNLNVTCPSSQADRKLPVFVFIHGGGFAVGSATWPQYDLAKFVRLSHQNGLPVVGVSLNYRLGAPGLLTSKEMREAGYLSNNAIRDQKTALQWVKKYISGFGGDPNNVTLAGESAGGVSCTFHLQSTEPLFKRVISMSGTSLLLSPLPEEVAEFSYQSAIKKLDLENKSTSERIAALLTTDAGTLQKELMTVPLLPIVDSNLPLASQTFSDFSTGKLGLPGVQWCEGMMIGDCQFDGNIQFLRLMHRKQDIGKAFCDSMQESFSSAEITDKLLQSFGITPELDDDAAFMKVLEILTDIGFYAPSIAYAEGLSSKGMKTWVYRFNEPNPWEGPWKGTANHILDVAFLFQNFNDYLDEPQRKSAETFAEDVIKFVNGQSPWDRWQSDARVAQVLGPEGKRETCEDVPEKVGRRGTLLELAEQEASGMDHLSDVLNAFLRGPPAT